MHRGMLLAGLALGGLASFVLLAATYDHEPLRSLDREVEAWIAAELPGAIEWVARPFSWLGGWIGLTALGVLAGALLARERAWLDLGFFLVAFLGSQLAVSVLKDVFERPRPSSGSPVSLPDSYAFPSGHAAAGAASVGALAILASERLESAAARRRLWIGVVVAGIAIGLSRVALNVHFVTDVVAGWCFGLAWLAACLLLRDRFRRSGI